MKDFDKGFIVGLVEGEGCITICRMRRANANGINDLRIDFSIRNNSRELLEKAKQILGKGNVYLHKKQKGHPKWADSYEYHLTKRMDVLHILKEIFPFLICKQKAAALVIEFCESRIERGAKQGKKRIPFSDRDFEIFNALRIRKR